ncbi:MAG: hypothetical protein J0M24_09285 [Verrucomicrobia bacterium]|nr:hypothetical protein [Verrucomicrobiota bacterium]
MFPTGSVTFDHALIMRDLRHQWDEEADIFTDRPTTNEMVDLHFAPRCSTERIWGE